MTKPALTTALTVRQLERQLRGDGFSIRGAKKYISKLSKNQLLGAAGNSIPNPAQSRKKNSP